jgi:hypothetical protein
MEAIAYLITISFSSIDSPCDLCSACLLPTVHLAILPYTYLNNNIIYLNSKEEYREYIKWVLRKLYKGNILITIKKYKFYTKKTDLIGFIIKLKQISIN